MLQRRILEPILENLPQDKAGYFYDLVAKLEEDPRTEAKANLVFSILRETVPVLPTYLPREELIERLFAFIYTHEHKLRRKMFDRDFIENSAAIRPITNEFFHQVVDRTLELYDDGEIDTGERKVYSFKFPAEDGYSPFEQLRKM